MTSIGASHCSSETCFDHVCKFKLPIYICECLTLIVITVIVIEAIKCQLTVSVLCFTHVDACLVPSHSRCKVEKVLQTMNDFNIRFVKISEGFSEHPSTSFKEKNSDV